MKDPIGVQKRILTYSINFQEYFDISQFHFFSLATMRQSRGGISTLTRVQHHFRRDNASQIEILFGLETVSGYLPVIFYKIVDSYPGFDGTFSRGLQSDLAGRQRRPGEWTLSHHWCLRIVYRCGRLEKGFFFVIVSTPHVYRNWISK